MLVFVGVEEGFICVVSDGCVNVGMIIDLIVFVLVVIG